jgi:hypothetical protein
MDDANPEKGANTGLCMIWNYTNDGQLVDLEGPLYVDLRQQDRLIINEFQIRLNLRRQRDGFCLLTIDREK